MTVSQLLADLGNTAEAIAASLQSRGFTGLRNKCGRCPIANYLQPTLLVLNEISNI